MPASDQIERVFLGHGGPALPAAADWLVQRFADDGAALGEVLVVVPGQRAQRRLDELLAQRSAGRALVPPRVTTLAEALREAGYETAAFTEGGYAQPTFGLGRGFDEYPTHDGDEHGYHYIHAGDGEDVDLVIERFSAADRLAESGVLDDLDEAKRQEILDTLREMEPHQIHKRMRVKVEEIHKDHRP